MHSQRRASIAISSSPPSFLLQGVVWVLDILMCNAMYVPIHLFTKSGEMCLKERVHRPKPCWSYGGWWIRTLCILVGYKTLLYLSIGFLIWSRNLILPFVYLTFTNCLWSDTREMLNSSKRCIKRHRRYNDLFSSILCPCPSPCFSAPQFFPKHPLKI